MEWHQFLREERARKLESIEMLSSGRITISVGEAGNIHDVSAEMVDDHKRHVIEIDEILAAAEKPFDA